MVGSLIGNVGRSRSRCRWPLSGVVATGAGISGDLKSRGRRMAGAGGGGDGGGNLLITFVTGNKKKLEEVVAILKDGSSHEGFTVTSQSIDLPELQGEPEEIAIEKCRLAFERIQRPVMVEDTSLCFNALGGLPGPYCKHFLEKCGHAGMNAMLHGFEDKTAYAQCIFTFTVDGSDIKTFVGRTDGKVVPARGDNQFGWDPIFEPAGFDPPQTYAEMPKETKNSISHRYRALDKLRKHLTEITSDS